MISETKTDNSFPKVQLLIKGFVILLQQIEAITGKHSRILFYVMEDIPVKLLSVEPLPAECSFFVEIYLLKRKCFFYYYYHYPRIKKFEIVNLKLRLTNE